MYKERRLVFYYATSPTHMGAGDGLGAIDSPIQREVQTNHPIMAGSGIKGAIRHELTGRWSQRGSEIESIFGPEPSGANFAGAISFSDANVVLFPVRSLKNAYLYATSREALARLKRSAEIAGIEVSWKIPSGTGALTSSNEIVADGKVVLEQFEVSANPNMEVIEIAKWISERIPSSVGEFFSNKIANHLIVLDDRHFHHFVTNSTVVEPHVRIEDETGSAFEGGLFYVENLPSESLMVGLMMASDSRSDSSDLSAAEIVKLIEGEGPTAGIHNSLIQFGGDATYGRGLVAVSSIKE
jgi:CRISPR-associated protein Cmr4